MKKEPCHLAMIKTTLVVISKKIMTSDISRRDIIRKVSTKGAVASENPDELQPVRRRELPDQEGICAFSLSIITGEAPNTVAI